MYMSSRYMSHVAHTPPIAWRMTMANHRSLAQGRVPYSRDSIRFVLLRGPGIEQQEQSQQQQQQPAAAGGTGKQSGKQQAKLLQTQEARGGQVAARKQKMHLSFKPQHPRSQIPDPSQVLPWVLLTHSARARAERRTDSLRAGGAKQNF